MRALRIKMRFGGWLALFALGLQLTLSFGHIHAQDFQAKDFAPANVPAAQSQSAPQNAPNDHNDGDHDGCAICAVMHLAATSVLPAPPSVVLPPAATFIVSVVADRTASPPSTRRPFQARAPPQA